MTKETPPAYEESSNYIAQAISLGNISELSTMQVKSYDRPSRLAIILAVYGSNFAQVFTSIKDEKTRDAFVDLMFDPPNTNPRGYDGPTGTKSFFNRSTQKQ